jgi:hypothetical protein
VSASDADSFTASGLPSGLSINPATGRIAGTINPRAAGSYSVTVTAFDVDASSSVTFAWTVNDTTAPALTNPGSQSNNEGDAVNLQVSASDGDSFAASGLPGGLSINPTTGLITGTIDSRAAGSYSVTVTATDNTATSSATFIWIVNDTTAPDLSNPGLQSNNEGDVVNLQVSAADADSFAASGLPGGLSIDPATGLISGTIPVGAAGSYSVTVTASDAGASSDATFTWTVDGAPTITSGDHPKKPFVEDSAGSFTITTSHSFPAPTLSETGALPDGVTFTDNHDGTATLAGIPNKGTEGTYTITITAANAAGRDVQMFAVNVLTPGEARNLIQSIIEIVEPGVPASVGVSGSDGSEADVELSLPANAAGPAALYVGSYAGNPTDTNPPALNSLQLNLGADFVYLDVRVTGPELSGATATSVFTFPASAIAVGQESNFEMRFWDGSAWQLVTDENGQRPTPQAVIQDGKLVGWTITVHIGMHSSPAITGLKGTVFTIALPTAAPSTPVVISPPQVFIGHNNNSDTSNGLASAATFASNASVTLVLRVSQDSELTASRTVVGGGGGGTITWLSEADDALLPWLRDVPWIWDIIRPGSATPAAGSGPRGTSATPARQGADAGTPGQGPAASEISGEADVQAIDACFAATTCTAPTVDTPTIAQSTPAAAWGWPLVAAVLALCGWGEGPNAKDRKRRAGPGRMPHER